MLASAHIHHPSPCSETSSAASSSPPSTYFDPPKPPTLTITINPPSPILPLLNPSSGSASASTLAGSAPVSAPSAASGYVPSNISNNPRFGPVAGASQQPNRPMFKTSSLPSAISPLDPSELIQKYLVNTSCPRILIIDTRPYTQFSQSRLRTAINICMPSTLIKRPSVTLSRLLDNLCPSARSRVESLDNYDAIVVYDDSTTIPNNSNILHTLLKFNNEPEYTQKSLHYLHGGLISVKNNNPAYVDTAPLSLTPTVTDSKLPSPMSPVFSVAFAASSKCFTLPSNNSTHVNLNNLELRLPAKINCSAMPAWLAEIVKDKQSVRTLARRFSVIEDTERARLMSALKPGNTKQTNNNPLTPKTSYNQQEPVTLAGVESGTKNRYNNIWPYESTRVRLHYNDEQGSDYINASYITTPGSKYRYIATQAPMESTVMAFWHMVFDKNVPLIMMLTAPAEPGRQRCHIYWQTTPKGPTVPKIQNDECEMDANGGVFGNLTVQQIHSGERILSETGNKVIIRKWQLTMNTDDNKVTNPMVKVVTQIQYDHWPDHGIPAHASDLVALVNLKREICNGGNNSTEVSLPVVVHCSAGCGRTGTFCVVDSVLDLLQTQKSVQSPKFISEEETSDNSDMIYQVVHQLRRQRMAMVQSLPQFILAYEAVITAISTFPELVAAGP
ncbi:hypothetical protein NADFUDRAFT_49812 [Nadsonia fulvescens var. elongata DSM 6958]|uniref:protein-tyrosine-phosphatase n=1 Tax=Nadsonia fulvescens var. elongata DSM 6958 TaxID=857566 RepID=A0A1E3PPZ8_9ASCO|nr:hypothetical protein NADFUDRAFT_49812 [Nadsonia fulvescens var. elongata DSM 6958]